MVRLSLDLRCHAVITRLRYVGFAWLGRDNNSKSLEQEHKSRGKEFVLTVEYTRLQALQSKYKQTPVSGRAGDGAFIMLDCCMAGEGRNDSPSQVDRGISGP
jgi:hypothetical protein